MQLIRAEQFAKTYRTGEIDVPAVKGVDFTIDAKSFVAFVGPSGSGSGSAALRSTCPRLEPPTISFEFRNGSDSQRCQQCSCPVR